MTDVYVAHRDGAAGFAGPVMDALSARLGPEHVGGTGLRGRTRPADCDVVVALIDTGWATRGGSGRDPMQNDLLTAHRQGVHVIPVLVQGAAMPSTARLPSDLRWLTTLNQEILRDEAWDRDVAHLTDVVIASPVTRPPVQASNARAVRLARRIESDVSA
jgi:hypothetical protein